MTKICSKCGIEKPLTKDYFQLRKSSKDGFRNECKECKSKYLKQYYENNKEEIIRKNTEYRKKNWDRFTENRRRYEEENKEILAEKRRVYYQENKEQIAESKKLSVAKNKEKYAQYYLNWARNNVDKCKEKRHRREAKLKKLPYTLTTEQWQIILNDFNNQCAYCGKEDEIQQEHFIALNKGGEYTHNNIIPACRSCNSSKQDTDFFEWYPKQEFYSEAKEKFILGYLNYNDEGIQQLALTL